MSKAEECAAALEWLANGGREAARELAKALDADPDHNLEEAYEWLTDIVEGKEI
jgi:hypothetical protein